VAKTETITVDFEKKSGRIHCSPHLLKSIRLKFSIENPVYQARRFESRKYVITPSGAFEVGLWDDINRYLLSLQIPLNIVLTDAFKAQHRPPMEKMEIQHIDGFDYYDYQEITIKEFIQNGRGISILATGAGKALCIAGLCKTLLYYKPNSRILIIVPNVGLLNQLWDSFNTEFNMGQYVERWGDNNLPSWKSNILIANTQILVSDINFTLSKVYKYDAVVVDEVHRLGEKKNQINKVIHNMVTPHRFGLTGTLPNNLLAAWNAIGKIGRILYEKSSYDIRQQGNISQVLAQVVYCVHSSKPAKPDPDDVRPNAAYEMEVDHIMSHPARNKIICKVIRNLTGNVLVLVDRIAYGQRLYDLLNDGSKQVFFISGDTDTTERTRIQKLMESHDDVVCVAMTTIFSTGISIKNLHSAIFTYIGKSNVKIVQSIGRTLRKHASKDRAIIIDVADSLRYSRKHLKERIKLYDEQQISYKMKTVNI